MKKQDKKKPVYNFDTNIQYTFSLVFFLQIFYPRK